MIRKIIWFWILCSLQNIFGQNDSIQAVKLEPIILKVSRISEKNVQIPMSISRLEFEKNNDIRQQLSFNEYLSGAPGIFTLNANNFSQDLRVSIRGFGARSAFGIRGIKILVDGIPETTPDGQGQIDNLNLAIIKNIEIIRGPSSALYGNASGGVISINTLDNISQNFMKVGLNIGSYQMRQYQVAFGLKGKNTNYIFQGNKISTDGYRKQSGFENYNFNLRMLHQFSPSSKLNFHLNYTNSPNAEDSGGLTIEEVMVDRKQARQRNVDFKTKEVIDQFKIGANFTHQWNRVTLNSYGFYSFRDFYGLLPFEIGGGVKLKRNYAGNGSSLTFQQYFNKASNKLQLGYDLAIQEDQRERFRNLEGVMGEKTFGQKESFYSLGFFVLDHFSIGKFLISTGLRYDRDRLKNEDKFLSDGDNSGEISLNSVNPSVGFNFMLNNKNAIYTGFSTSFETPTLSELSSNPSAGGGFNEVLRGQKARNYEVGYKFDSKIKQFEFAFFYIETDNDLVPYELEEFPDRTFYRNAGSTSRKGIEISFQSKITENLNVKSSYTFSDFKYSSYQTISGSFDGNTLPGIPKHLAFVSFDYQNKTGLSLRVQTQYVGNLYNNDANNVTVDGYSVVNFNSGFELKTKSITFLPFLGINNLFDTKYNDNIRINAFGGRYYEPAPGINIFGGVRLIF